MKQKENISKQPSCSTTDVCKRAIVQGCNILCLVIKSLYIHCNTGLYQEVKSGPLRRIESQKIFLKIQEFVWLLPHVGYNKVRHSEELSHEIRHGVCLDASFSTLKNKTAFVYQPRYGGKKPGFDSRRLWIGTQVDKGLRVYRRICWCDSSPVHLDEDWRSFWWASP